MDGEFMDTKEIRKRLTKRISEHSEALSSLGETQVDTIKNIVETIVSALKKGNKVLTAGNGGSTCDAQHFACEFIGKFMIDRKALPAVCLCNDIASTYAIGNDYSFDLGLARALEGLGKKGDVFVGFSTSGNATNLLNAAKYAKKNGIKVIFILGRDGGKIVKQKMYDLVYIVKNTSSTPRIQEMHGILMHTICEEVELLFKDKKSKVY